ncbi:MAG: DUF4349 domain-containing protein [Dehalococcoidia bacterium]|nr:DUF4349 domain-containing protein [Dehalococcoidia bacterium]MDP7470264.1 DUF4349 domain-containing protein [Dehalococcoidia bacterium]
MKRIALPLVAVFLLLSAACGGEVTLSEPSVAPTPMPAPGASAMKIAGTPTPVGGSFAQADAEAGMGEERLIVRNASLSLLVSDMGDALSHIEAMAGRLGGFVVSSSRREDRAASISIRIPAEQFSQAMDELRGLAERVEDENTQSRDVTEEYVDLESRLRNLDASEEQLLGFMEKAEKLEDVVNVFRELSSVRERIEVTQGRMQYLERTSAMSLINVNLRPVSSPEPVVKPGWSLQENIKSALRGLSSVGQGLASAAIWLLLLSPVWLPLLLIVFFLGRRLRKKL